MIIVTVRVQTAKPTELFCLFVDLLVVNCECDLSYNIKSSLFDLTRNFILSLPDDSCR